MLVESVFFKNEIICQVKSIGLVLKLRLDEGDFAELGATNWTVEDLGVIETKRRLWVNLNPYKIYSR